MKAKTTPWLATALLMGIVLVAWALRVYHLGTQSLWVDEGFSWEVARQGPGAILRLLPAEDRHPPLHYLLLWLTMQLAGSSEFSLRFLSAGVGTLAIPLVYWLGRRLNGPAVGLAAAALIAISPFHVWYSQEARMYALLMTFGLLSLVFALLVTDSECSQLRRWPAAGYVVSTAGALYTHYYGVFLLPAHVILALLHGNWRARWREWLALPIIAVVLFAPWLLGVWPQYQRAPHGYVPNEGLPAVLWNVASTYTVGENIVPNATVIVAVAAVLALLGVVAVWGSTLGRREARLRGGLALLGWLLAAPVGAYVMTTILGIDIRATGRMYYIAGLPPFALLVARGIAGIGAALGLVWARLQPGTRSGSPRLVPLGTMALGLGVAIAVQQPILHYQYFDRPKEDFRAAAHYIQAHEWPGDGIILDAEYIYRPFEYYYHGTAPWYRAVVEPGRVDAAMLKQTAGHDRVWLVLSHAEFADPKQRVETWLNQHAAVLGDEWYAGIHVRLYGFQPNPPTVAPPVEKPLGIRLGNAVELYGADVPSRTTGGNSLHLKLIWHPLAHISENDHVVLQIVDAGGHVWSQTDHIPIGPLDLPTQWQPGQYLIDYSDLPVPLGLPQGTYHINLKLYAPSTGRALQPRTGGDFVTLGSVHVGPTIAPRPLAGKNVAPNLRLLNASLDATKAQQGDVVPVKLLWQAIGSTARAPSVDLRLFDGNGREAATQQVKLAGGSHPFTAWKSNEVVRDRVALRIPGRLVAGSYRVEVGATTFQPVGQLTVSAIQRSYTVPTITHPQEATLGNSFAFLGFDLAPLTARPGGVLHLTLYWKALTDPTVNYTVFTHLVGPDGRIYAQHDGQPVAGTRPTSDWLKGEVIRDPYTLTIAAKAPPGTYTLEIGMYRPDNGVRLPIVTPSGQGNRLILKEKVDVANRR